MDPTTRERALIPLGSEAVPTFVLTVLRGLDAGKEVLVDPLSATRVYVGTSAACDLVLTDPLVSRRHLGVAVDARHLRLTDVGSTNGTWVNDVRVVEALLGGGEAVRIGDTTLRLSVSAVQGAGRPLGGATRFGRLVGASTAMRQLYPLCERLAHVDVPVILEGETGTGKELLAEALHEASPRAGGPFVVFDCTTAPPSLVESALFGHERGAFTGATSARAGVFEQAHGGTLLIDEIGDLDVALQAKLLRAVERGEVQRVGGSGWTKVDVRLLVATRRDLESAIQAGRFRDDLYYRLAVARIELPPLRRREGDIAVLAEHFWKVSGGSGALPAELLPQLTAYAWPGNVRELANAVAHRLALGPLASPQSIRRPASVPPPNEPATDLIDKTIREELPFSQAKQRVLETFERRYVEWVLAKHGGNVAKAATASGIARRYFYVVRSRAEG